MHIWVDADACPKAIKEILYRAVNRTATFMTLVANQSIAVPPSPYIKTIRVGAGFDVADQRIIQEMSAGDLVITGDIPLADEVITKQGIALNPRGELFSVENIKQKLAIRNLMSGLRDSGLVSGGPDKLGTKELTAFANQLDRILARG